MKRREERAAAAVEFALVMPLLLAFLFGIIVFGVIFAQDLALGNSARQAARVGVVEGRTCTELLAEIDETIDTIGVGDHTDLDAVAITRNGGSACGDEGPCAGSAEADSIRVELIYRAEPMLPVPGVGTIEITGEGQFRCEYR